MRHFSYDFLLKYEQAYTAWVDLESYRNNASAPVKETQTTKLM